VSEQRTGWRAVFSPNEVIQRVRPTESRKYIRNPHRGTTTFQRFNGDPLYPGLTWNDSEGPEKFKPFDGNLKNDRYPDTTISYCRWLWSVIEPEKGKYRWDIIDGALQAAEERGQSLQVRIQPYIMSLPAWYWKTGAKALPATRGGVSEPDHNDPLYVEHWGEFIRAFGARYDGHPNLESFDVAYGGPCGEGGGNASPETAAKLVDIYAQSFRKTQLISMLGTHGCKYAAKKRLGFGWRADCFGDLRADGRGEVPDHLCWCHMKDAYPREVVECGVKDAWRTAPVILETCWTVGHWYEKGWDIDWIIEQGYKYHMSVFMPKSSYFPEAWREKLDAFDRRIGYRFVLRQVTMPLEAKPGQRIEFLVWIDNVGVAPIYRPYKLALRFRQGDRHEIVLLKADIRKWLPDHTWFSEKVLFPKTLRPGEVKVDMGIVEPATGKVRVRFAIEEVLPDGWHPLSSMDVLG